MPVHRYWRETQDAKAYLTWASGFKVRITQTIEQWKGLSRIRRAYVAAICQRQISQLLPDRYETEPSSGGTSKGHPEVPPDNNQAERSLRLAVTKRKVSGGSRSMERFAQTADLLSVVQTCRRLSTLSHKVFSVSFDGEVGEWEFSTISTASTDHLNPYVRKRNLFFPRLVLGRDLIERNVVSCRRPGIEISIR